MTAVGLKLWLDDVRPAPDGWVHCTTAPAAIALLSANDVDEISLDHDLGPDENGTGYDVLLWVERQVARWPHFIVPAIRVHTANPVARRRMLAALRSIRRLASI